jgi:AraC family transcriptional regulator, carnitine catabolism transcriptional activator
VERAVRLFVCAGNPAKAATSPAIVTAVERHYRFGGIVGGICTRAFALARASLLTARRFTLQWENQPGFAEIFPGLTPTSNRFETDGRVITCGGGAASTDMMLSIIAADHGPDFAAMVSEMCLRTLMSGTNSQQKSSLAALMSSRNPVLIATVTSMNRHIENTLSLDQLADAAGYSRRHLERLFRDATGQTPADFYRNLRLDHGRNLLCTTELGLQEGALACGFGSTSHFSKSFKAKFLTAPTGLKSALASAQGLVTPSASPASPNPTTA